VKELTFMWIPEQEMLSLCSTWILKGRDKEGRTGYSLDNEP